MFHTDIFILNAAFSCCYLIQIYLLQLKECLYSFLYVSHKSVIRALGLVTNYGEGGGGHKTGGGPCEVLPLQKGGRVRKRFSHAEGGGGAKNVLG